MQRPFNVSRWAQLAMVALVLIIGVVHYEYQIQGHSLAGQLALQKLDLFYLNQPVPNLAKMNLKGHKGVLIVCATCDLPSMESLPNVEVRRTSDPRVAALYGLLTTDNMLGPGYVLIDSHGRVRYRTFDINPAQHAREIRVLVRNLP